MTDQAEKRKRAPGAGRKPLSATERKKVVTVRLSPEQAAHVREKGGAEHIRRLIDQDRNVTEG